MTDTSIKQQGNRYLDTCDLPITEIAKMIRADIKAAVAANDLPFSNEAGQPISYSVRSSVFAGGQAIDVRVVGWGDGRQERAYVQLSNGLYGPDWQTDPETGEDFVSWMTPAARRLDAKLNAVVAAYNQDRSDISSDYFSNRFYASVAFR